MQRLVTTSHPVSENRPLTWYGIKDTRIDAKGQPLKSPFWKPVFQIYVSLSKRDEAWVQILQNRERTDLSNEVSPRINHKCRASNTPAQERSYMDWYFWSNSSLHPEKRIGRVHVLQNLP